MKHDSKQECNEHLNRQLAHAGFRSTSQRRHVYDVVLQQPNHPTAEMVFMRVKSLKPDISLATVYNCLETLVACNLLRSVNLERAATRFCANMEEHMHFYCEECGRVFDIKCPAQQELVTVLQAPKNFKPLHMEVNIRGLCSKCAAKPKRKSR